MDNNEWLQLSAFLGSGIIGLVAYEFFKNNGHAALYWKFIRNPPIKLSKQFIIEMQSDGMHWENTVQDSMDEVDTNDFWGVKTNKNLTFKKRNSLIRLAESIREENPPKYGFFQNGYKNPDGKPPSFRCDGLVEYLYESIGHDIIPNDVGDPSALIETGNQTVLTPRRQMEAMENREAADAPEIQIKTSQGEIINDEGMTFDKTIIVNVNDGEKGSGIDRVEIRKNYLLEPFYIDTNNYQRDKTYIFSDMEEGRYKIIAYDQAGNKSQSSSFNIYHLYLYDNACFIDDINIDDYSEVPSGDSFTKIWQIKNNGDTIWNIGYEWAFDSGNKMQGPNSVPVSGISPNETVDISVNLVAPDSPGTYTGYWQMKNDSDTPFGDKCWIIITVIEEKTQWEFDTFNNFEDWSLSGISTSTVDHWPIPSSPVYFIINPHIDPYICSPEISLDSSKYNAVEFRMNSCSSNNQGQVFFKTSNPYNETDSI